MDDRSLIRRYQDGRTESLDVLVERHQTPLYTMCRKLTRCEADAEELFQDTWIKALAAMDRVDPERSFLSWLITICINLYRDRCRKRKRWRMLVVGSRDDSGLQDKVASIGNNDPGPDQLLNDAEVRARVRWSLDRLDNDHRLPLLLYYYRQMQVAEIGAVLGIPEGTVKSRLANGRRKILIQIEGDRGGRA